MTRWMSRIPTLLLLVCVGVLSCAEEEDGNVKPLETGDAGIGTEPGGGAGGEGSSGGGGATDGSSKPPGSSGVMTSGTDSDGTSGTGSSPTGGTPTDTATDVCAALSIPLACCECLLVGEACVSALDSCRADPDCACVTFCWYGGQGSFDDCVDSCSAAGAPLVVDLRICIDAACPICLP